MFSFHFKHFDPLHAPVLSRPDPLLPLIASRARKLLLARTVDELQAASFVFDRMLYTPRETVRPTFHFWSMGDIHKIRDRIDALKISIEVAELPKLGGLTNGKRYEYFAMLSLLFVEKILAEEKFLDTEHIRTFAGLAKQCLESAEHLYLLDSREESAEKIADAVQSHISVQAKKAQEKRYADKYEPQKERVIELFRDRMDSWRSASHAAKVIHHQLTQLQFGGVDVVSELTVKRWILAYKKTVK